MENEALYIGGKSAKPLQVLWKVTYIKEKEEQPRILLCRPRLAEHRMSMKRSQLADWNFDHAKIFEPVGDRAVYSQEPPASAVVCSRSPSQKFQRNQRKTPSVSKTWLTAFTLITVRHRELREGVLLFKKNILIIDDNSREYKTIQNSLTHNESKHVAKWLRRTNGVKISRNNLTRSFQWLHHN